MINCKYIGYIFHFGKITFITLFSETVNIQSDFGQLKQNLISGKLFDMLEGNTDVFNVVLS